MPSPITIGMVSVYYGALLRVRQSGKGLRGVGGWASPEGAVRLCLWLVSPGMLPRISGKFANLGNKMKAGPYTTQGRMRNSLFTPQSIRPANDFKMSPAISTMAAGFETNVADDPEDTWFRGWFSLLVADGLQSLYSERRCVECFEHFRDGVKLICFRFDVEGKIYSLHYPGQP